MSAATATLDARLDAAALDWDACWAAMAARDHGSARAFVAAVTSTRIFCRPGCPARLPRRENMRFYASAAEAMAAGFRPCRRCLPLAIVPDVGLASIAAICRLIEARAHEPLPLALLAARAGYSPAHFQRRFTALVGISPRAYHGALRARAYRRALRAEPSATAALYAAGYGSSARVAGSAGPLGALTPTQYRRGGADMDLAYTIITTRFGPLLLAASARGVVFTAFGEAAASLAALRAEFPHAALHAAAPQAGAIAAWGQAIEAHLAGRLPDPRLPLDIRGTAFQQLVWDYLVRIPAGQTRSYAQVAAGVGRPAAVRAAASACAANKVAILIPCHRVIRGDAGLGGYRWGVELKRALLAAEGGALL